MKLGIVSLLLVFTLLPGCDQGEQVADPAPGCGIRVKVIYHYCSYAFVQILDGKYQHLADAEWTHAYNGKTYEHVFNVKNPCVLGDGGYSFGRLEGEVFEINIINEFEDSCVYCLPLYAGRLPKAGYAIRLCSDEESPEQ